MKINKNIYLVADIHGEYHKLKSLYSSLNLSDEDHLVFLGDYIGNADNLNTLILLQQIKNKHNNTFFIKGNHEDSLLYYLKSSTKEDFLDKKAVFRNLIELGYPQGSKEILKSFLKNNNITFLDSLIDYYENDDFLATHAPLNNSTKHSFDIMWNFTMKEDKKINGLDKWLICGHQNLINCKIKRKEPSIYSENKQIFLDCGCGYEKDSSLFCLHFPDFKIYRSSV